MELVVLAVAVVVALGGAVALVRGLRAAQAGRRAGGSGGSASAVERTALSAHEVLQELTFMSLKGLIQRIDGQTYNRRKN